MRSYLRKSLATNVADVRLNVIVGALVFLKRRILGKAFGAIFAKEIMVSQSLPLVGFFSGVLSHVFLKRLFASKLALAFLANEACLDFCHLLFRRKLKLLFISVIFLY